MNMEATIRITIPIMLKAIRTLPSFRARESEERK
jgi:hypothetical protein